MSCMLFNSKWRCLFRLFKSLSEYFLKFLESFKIADLGMDFQFILSLSKSSIFTIWYKRLYQSKGLCDKIKILRWILHSFFNEISSLCMGNNRATDMTRSKYIYLASIDQKFRENFITSYRCIKSSIKRNNLYEINL